jgi:hypothetical protein
VFLFSFPFLLEKFIKIHQKIHQLIRIRMGDEIEISAIVGFCCPPLREAEALRSGPGSERRVGTYVFANYFLTYGQFLANFKRSVLGCIDAKFRK